MIHFSQEDKFKGALGGILLREFFKEYKSSDKGDNYAIDNALEIAISLGKSLIKYQKFDFILWLEDLETNKSDFLPYQNTFNDMEIIIICLPLSLFYFDNIILLRENVELISDKWRSPFISSQSMITWSLIMKILIENDLNSTNLIKKLVELMTQQNLLCPEILIIIDNWIQTKTPLHQITEQLHKCKDQSLGIIAQVLYCFLTRKDNSELCLLRAKTTTYYPNATTTLTALLLGLYQGYDYFPLKWRLLISSSVLYQEINILSSNLAKLWRGFLTI